MPKFKVTVLRVETRYQVVTVDAPNAGEAKELAETQTEDDDDWSDERVQEVEIRGILTEALPE